MKQSDLATLLSDLRVMRHQGVWAFATIPEENADWADLVNLRSVRNIALLFREREGLTLIHQADLDTAEENRWVWLELTVFSDLQAVGFLAKVSEALSKAGVPCNAVAGYHHDHIFVPEIKAETAIEALNGLTAKTSACSPDNAR